LALRISGTASEVAAYLATLGDDVEVAITIEQAPAPKAPAPAPKAQAAAPKAPGKRGPGRPKAQPTKEAPIKATSSQGCAVIGCANPVRSKGYCAAHYQKYNNLKKTGRAADFGWTDDAPPQSVTNPTLPRGRAGAEAKAGAKTKSAAKNDDVEPVKAVLPRIRRAAGK